MLSRRVLYSQGPFYFSPFLSETQGVVSLDKMEVFQKMKGAVLISTLNSFKNLLAYLYL